MGDGSLPHPERNRATRNRLFEIVDNQCRSLGGIDVESGHLSYYLHLDFCPISGDEVDIRLIFARSFAAELIPREAGNRDVLGRMIPLQLILRSSILGSNVKALEMRSILHTERNPHETAQLRRRIRRGIARQDHFNGAVLERCSTHEGQTVAIFGVL